LSIASTVPNPAGAAALSRESAEEAAEAAQAFGQGDFTALTLSRLVRAWVREAVTKQAIFRLFGAPQIILS